MGLDVFRKITIIIKTKESPGLYEVLYIIQYYIGIYIEYKINWFTWDYNFYLI